LGLDLPPHEKMRLERWRTGMWLMDSSGRSGGKDFTVAAFHCLTCLLFPNTRNIHIGPKLRTGILLVKDHIEPWYNRCPVLASQVKAILHASTGWTVEFWNGSILSILAPNVQQDSDALRSERCNVLSINEWKVFPQQIIDNVLVPLATRPREDPLVARHPGASNKIIFTATGGYRFEPNFNRVLEHQIQERLGNKQYCFLRYDYRDIPPSFKHILPKKVVEYAMRTAAKSTIDTEWHGLWISDSEGVFKASLLAAARSSVARVELLRPPLDPGSNEYRYVVGVDVASGGQYGNKDAFAVAAVRWDGENVRLVWMWRAIGITADQMASVIHEAHRAFAPDLIVMDFRGGGLEVRNSLRKDTITTVTGVKKAATPIVTHDDIYVADCHRVLVPFLPGNMLVKRRFQTFRDESAMIDMMMRRFQGLLETGKVVAPASADVMNITGVLGSARTGAPATAGEAEALDHIDVAFDELLGVKKKVDSEGRVILNKYRFPTYEAGAGLARDGEKLRKDAAYAFLYAHFGCMLLDVELDEEEGGGLAEMTVMEGLR